MDLARLEFNLRPRSPWEAIDLGFALARRWFIPLLSLWLLTVLPVTLLLSLLLHDNLTLMSLAIWWCKPIYEPPMMFWLSRAVFGERLPLKAVARDWWRINRRGVLGNLTLRRLGPSRSFTMPVSLLEGLKGAERSKRINVLGRNQQAGAWLTIVGIHFETILELGLIVTLLTLLPEQLHWIEMENLFLAPNFVEQLLWICSWVLGMAIIAPFYVAGGFSLYLHRRSELEGWDIEINFRRTVEKLTPQRRKRSAQVAIVVAALCTLFSVPQDASAESLGPQQSRQLVEQVLAEPRFGRLEEQSYWEYVGEAEKEEDVDHSWLEALIKLLKVFIEIIAGFAEGTASLVEILIWLTVFGVIAYLLYHLSRNAEWMQNLIGLRQQHRRELPGRLFGLDVSAESLPEDIAGEAMQLLQQGSLRQALSLLYRGTLLRLISEHQLEIPASATEGECLSLVEQRRSADEAEFFSRLTRLWLITAYAHLPPPAPQIERLCRDWQRVYGNGEH